MNYELTEGQLNPPAEPEVLDGLLNAQGFLLPCSYLDFLKEHDGGEGFLADNFIMLWRADELIDFNREYEVAVHAPRIFLFGSTGGGEGYGFDTQDAALPIVRLPFIGMARHYAEVVARDLPELFARLADRND